MKIPKIVGFVLGGLVLVGSVIAAFIGTVQATAATFTAVAAMAVPVIVAYLAAIVVFSNLFGIVLGLVWFAVAALCGIMAFSDSRTHAIYA